MEFKKVLKLSWLLLGSLGWVALIITMYISPFKEKDILSADMTYNYVKSVVWYHSRGKLQELKGILTLVDLSRKNEVKLKIENMLKHRTSAYIREFNRLNSPINSVGDTYAELFDFTPFLDEIFDVVFNEKLDINQKISDVTDIMEMHQTKANSALLLKMNEKENE